MHFSGLQVTAWVMILVGSGCLLGALFTDYWSTHHPRQSIDNLRMHRGLFKQCLTTNHQSNCHHRFANVATKFNSYMDVGMDTRMSGYQQQSLQVFEIVVLTLFLGAEACATFILICGPYCCGKCQCCMTYITILTAGATIVGCFIYAYYNSRGQTFTLRQSIYQDVFNYDFGSDINELGWSYYMAVLAAISYTLGVVLLGCSKPPQQSYETVSVV